MPKTVDVVERRAELAAAAARVIARSGIGAATVREVAAEAGWTTGALTHYFADKRSLLQFTLAESLERRRARRSDRVGVTAQQALREVLVRALPIEEDARLHWIVTLAFSAQAASDPELAVSQVVAYREFRADVTGLVERAGRAAGDASQVEAERLIALLDGVSLQAIFDPESWPADRQRAAIDAAL